jgi:hypothetical protein
MLICHLRARSNQGTLALIALSWWQLRLGTSKPPLEDLQFRVPYDSPHWLSAHRTFLASIDGSIHIADLKGTNPTPLRATDICLMDVVAPMTSHTTASKTAFNRVRIHLGVTYLSKIATADGLSLARDAWDGSRTRLSPFLWPFQPCPGPKSFRCWRRILANIFLSGERRRVSSRTRDLRLRQRLGPWLSTSTSFRLHWDAFFPPSSYALFVANMDGRYSRHVTFKTRRRPKHPVRAFQQVPAAQGIHLPADALPKLLIPGVSTPPCAGWSFTDSHEFLTLHPSPSIIYLTSTSCSTLHRRQSAKTRYFLVTSRRIGCLSKTATSSP